VCVTTVGVQLAHDRKLGSARPGRDSFLLTSTMWFTQLLGVGILVVVANKSDAINFANLLTVLACSAFLVTILDFGSNSKWVIELSSGALSIGAWMRLSTAKASATLICTLTLAATAFLGSPLLVQIASLTLVQAAHQNLHTVLKVFDRNVRLATSLLVERTTTFLLILCMVFWPSSVFELAFLPFLIGSLAGISVSIGAAGGLLKAEKFVWVWPWWPLRYWAGSGRFALVSVASATKALDVGLMNLLGQHGYSANFGAVSRWVQPLLTAATAYSAVSVPILTIQGFGRDSFRKILRSAIPLLLAVSGMLLVLPFSGQLVLLVLGPRFGQAAELLPWLVLAGIFSSLSSVIQSWIQIIEVGYLASWATFGAVMLHLVGVSLVSVGGFPIIFAGLIAAFASCLNLVALCLVFVVFLKRSRRC
jgi:O-antigen/teichoic acid export membrane protein